MELAPPPTPNACLVACGGLCKQVPPLAVLAKQGMSVPLRGWRSHRCRTWLGVAGPPQASIGSQHVRCPEQNHCYVAVVVVVVVVVLMFWFG